MTHSIRRSFQNQQANRGFTLVELLVGSALMLLVIVGALSVYSRSNNVSLDQQRYAELQHDVRASMFLIARDVRMAGAGLPIEYNMYVLEGIDNEDQGQGAGDVTPDRLIFMGNIEDPLNLTIQNYAGSSANVTVNDFSFEEHPYPDDYYDNKLVLVLANPASTCREREYRIISQVIHDIGGTNEKLVFAPGQAPGINPPGGLSTATCQAGDYIGGLITFVNVREYWLDVTGAFPGLVATQNGYLGTPGVLYMTEGGFHSPLAQDVENLQFEYNGDLNNDGALDGFAPWNNQWTLDQISRIRQARILILGRTADRFLSVSGQPPGGIQVYSRPAVSNDATGASAANNMCRRFLLETTSNIRNMSLNLYNTGER